MAVSYILVCFSRPFFCAEYRSGVRPALLGVRRLKKNQNSERKNTTDDYQHIEPADEKDFAAGKKGKSQERGGRFFGGGDPDVPGGAAGENCQNICIRKLLEKRAGKFKDRKIEVVEDRVFQSVSDTMTPQGILSIVRQFHYREEDFWKKKNPFFLVLENLQDPGNMGTIFRTAEGAGADGIFLSRDCVDLYNPKVIRSTMGSIYRMPFLYVDSAAELAAELQRRDVRVFAAHLKGEKSYDKESYLSGTAFLIGNEGNGLTEELAEKADSYIKIPMAGKVESLNAAMAAGILMYEVSRQRRQKAQA